MILETQIQVKPKECSREEQERFIKAKAMSLYSDTRKEIFVLKGLLS